MFGLGNNGEPKPTKLKKVREPRDPVTKERVIEGLVAFGRNVMLVLTVVAILVVTVAINLLFKRVGGASDDEVVGRITLMATGLTAVGGFLTLWLGRTWGIIPY